MKLVCPICKKEVEYCSLTGCMQNKIDKDGVMWCCEGEHFCSESCLKEYYIPEEATECEPEEAGK